jgi:hypothetical protein
MSEIELVKRLRGIADHEEKLSRIVKLRDEEIADVRMGADAIEALTAALDWAMLHGNLRYTKRIAGQNEAWCDGIDRCNAALRKVRP